MISCTSYLPTTINEYLYVLPYTKLKEKIYEILKHICRDILLTINSILISDVNTGIGRAVL